MEGNPATLFRIFDYLTASLTGLTTALLVFLLVSPRWPMVLGMALGMALGVASLGLVFVGLGWVAGPFEIIMPGKFIGMIVGMAGGMWAASGGATLGGLFAFGVTAGLILAAVFHLYDKTLHGE